MKDETNSRKQEVIPIGRKKSARLPGMRLAAKIRTDANHNADFLYPPGII